jgi:hypothetical protein
MNAKMKSSRMLFYQTGHEKPADEPLALHPVKFQAVEAGNAPVDTGRPPPSKAYSRSAIYKVARLKNDFG